MTERDLLRPWLFNHGSGINSDSNLDIIVVLNTLLLQMAKLTRIYANLFTPVFDLKT